MLLLAAGMERLDIKSMRGQENGESKGLMFAENGASVDLTDRVADLHARRWTDLEVKTESVR